MQPHSRLRRAFIDQGHCDAVTEDGVCGSAIIVRNRFRFPSRQNNPDAWQFATVLKCQTGQKPFTHMRAVAAGSKIGASRLQN